MIQEYLNYLQESTTLYHASPDQGLKLLDPKETASTHFKKARLTVYATDDKAYASCFSFTWHSEWGFKLGRYRDNDPWLLEVPKKHKKLMEVKSSIYIVDSKGFKKLKGATTPEYYSETTVRVISEEKYRTARECILKNGAKIKLI